MIRADVHISVWVLMCSLDGCGARNVRAFQYIYVYGLSAYGLFGGKIVLALRRRHKQSTISLENPLETISAPHKYIWVS